MWPGRRTASRVARLLGATALACASVPLTGSSTAHAEGSSLTPTNWGYFYSAGIDDLTILTTWPFASASHLLLYQRNCRILLRLSFLGPYLTLPAICAGSLRTGLTSLRSHGEYQYFAADAMNRRVVEVG